MSLLPQISTKKMHDIKRVRGQISCAECRRLKLKCDKKIPCSSCIRRGCKSVCPTETSPAQMKRSPETASLYTQVETMSQRIRDLENALSTLQSSISTSPYPEISNSLQEIRKPETFDALGTLTLDRRGDARYLGRSAGLESLLEDGPKLPEIEDEEDEDDHFPAASEEISQLPKYFPFASDCSWDVGLSLQLILSHLPPKERAWTLAEFFIENSPLQIKVVSSEELFDELLTPIYRYVSAMDFAGQKCPLSPTRLAVLFICFAHGSMADIGIPMYCAESEDFLRLSRISLSLHPIILSPDLASVQALTLIGMFHDTGGRSYNIEAAWSFLTIASKLSQSLGLHRESPKWGLDKKTLHRRRTIFWEILTWDAMLSLSLGRPPCFFGAHVDTPLPLDEDASVNEKGDTEPGFHHWRMSFTRDVVTAVSDITLSSDMPDYPTILNLDRRMREHPLPEKYDPLRFLYGVLERTSLNTLDDPREMQSQNETSSITLKSFHLTHFRALVAMFIHRAFFAQALLQSPSNPLSSVYAPSFLAAYRAASIVVHCVVKHFYKYYQILSRFWAIWNGLLTAGTILGLIVTRCPSSPLAANAYEELGLAVNLFKMGANHSDKAKRGLHVLLQMHEKATNVYESQAGSMRDEMNVAQEDMDALHTLEMFAGYTKLLMKDMASNPRVLSDKADSRNLNPEFDSGSLGSGPQRNALSQEQYQANFLPRSSSFRTVMPSATTYHDTDPDASPSIEHSHSAAPFLRTNQPVDQVLDHQHPYPAHTGHEHNFVSSSSITPTMYSYENERHAAHSSGMSSQVAYGMNSYSQYNDHGEHWTDTRSQYDSSVYPLFKREDNRSSTYPDSQFWPSRSERNDDTSQQGRPPLVTTVGAMNFQWAELVQDEGLTVLQRAQM
ncbi:MAG: fungal-specific transcription factor domain-containing protein [Lentinula lateritia]|nr:MAG: fungal-specific transcription factor domain-containing protein [Lentinula lateritia]